MTSEYFPEGLAREVAKAACIIPNVIINNNDMYILNSVGQISRGQFISIGTGYHHITKIFEFGNKTGIWCITTDAKLIAIEDNVARFIHDDVIDLASIDIWFYFLCVDGRVKSIGQITDWEMINNKYLLTNSSTLEFPIIPSMLPLVQIKRDHGLSIKGELLYFKGSIDGFVSSDQTLDQDVSRLLNHKFCVLVTGSVLVICCSCNKRAVPINTTNYKDVVHMHDHHWLRTDGNFYHTQVLISPHVTAFTYDSKTDGYLFITEHNDLNFIPKNPQHQKLHTKRNRRLLKRMFWPVFIICVLVLTFLILAYVVAYNFKLAYDCHNNPSYWCWKDWKCPYSPVCTDTVKENCWAGTEALYRGFSNKCSLSDDPTAEVPAECRCSFTGTDADPACHGEVIRV